MRKLVVLLVVMLALFSFIRDFPSATPNAASAQSGSVVRGELKTSLVP